MAVAAAKGNIRRGVRTTQERDGERANEGSATTQSVDMSFEMTWDGEKNQIELKGIDKRTKEEYWNSFDHENLIQRCGFPNRLKMAHIRERLHRALVGDPQMMVNVKFAQNSDKRDTQEVPGIVLKILHDVARYALTYTLYLEKQSKETPKKESKMAPIAAIEGKMDCLHRENECLQSKLAGACDEKRSQSDEIAALKMALKEARESNQSLMNENESLKKNVTKRETPPKKKESPPKSIISGLDTLSPRGEMKLNPFEDFSSRENDRMIDESSDDEDDNDDDHDDRHFGASEYPFPRVALSQSLVGGPPQSTAHQEGPEYPENGIQPSREINEILRELDFLPSADDNDDDDEKKEEDPPIQRKIYPRRISPRAVLQPRSSPKKIPGWKPKYLSISQLKKLKPSDKVDYRDKWGQFRLSTIKSIKKNGMTLRYQARDQWVDISVKMSKNRFTKPYHVSNRQAHRFKHLKIDDWIDLHTDCIQNGPRNTPSSRIWIHGRITKKDSKSGQVQVEYMKGEKQWRSWVHLDDSSEVAEAFTRSTLQDEIEKHEAVREYDVIEQVRFHKKLHQKANFQGCLQRPIESRVRAAFYKCLSSKKYAISEIDDITKGLSSHQREMFEATLKSIPEPNEKYLWYPCKHSDYPKIIQNGFTSELACVPEGIHPTQYLKGIYFSVKPDQFWNSADVVRVMVDDKDIVSEFDERILLLCRVIVGDPLEANQIANESEPISVVDSLANPSFVVIHEDFHAIPLLRIRFHMTNTVKVRQVSGISPRLSRMSRSVSNMWNRRDRYPVS